MVQCQLSFHYYTHKIWIKIKVLPKFQYSTKSANARVYELEVPFFIEVIYTYLLLIYTRNLHELQKVNDIIIDHLDHVRACFMNMQMTHKN